MPSCFFTTGAYEILRRRMHLFYAAFLPEGVSVVEICWTEFCPS